MVQNSPGADIRSVQRIKNEEEALSKINSNDVRHLFVKEGHNLSGLAEELGSEEEVARQLVSAVARRGLADGLQKVVVPLAGRTVVVSGRVINGVFRLGTAYIPQGFGF